MRNRKDLAAGAAAIVVIAAGTVGITQISTGGHHKQPPGVTRLHKAAESCPLRSGERSHQAGDCAPASQKLRAPLIQIGGRRFQTRPGAGVRAECIDLSNNDPVGPSGMRAIRDAGFRCLWVKLIEASFTDPDAAHMVADAKVNGILVGGYDFAHVCTVQSTWEGNRFADRILALKLTMQSALDVEFGGCSTQSATRAWIVNEYKVVRAKIRQGLGAYSGNWWLEPHTGCLFASLPADAWSWISGYPHASPPCGRHVIEVHQDTDRLHINGIGFGMDHSAVNRPFSLEKLKIAPSVGPQAIANCTELNKFRARKAQRGSLGDYGKGRVTILHRYFAKKHEHGTALYVCHYASNTPERRAA